MNVDGYIGDIPKHRRKYDTLYCKGCIYVHGALRNKDRQKIQDNNQVKNTLYLII